MEKLVSFGYTEPDSGSDVAAAQTRAVRDGNEWVINGQNVDHWHTSLITFSFSPEQTRCSQTKGLTFFIVPLNAEGIEYSQYTRWERSDQTPPLR